MSRKVQTTYEDFYRKLRALEVELLQVGTFNIEIIYVVIVYRVLQSRNSMKSGKGVTYSDSEFIPSSNLESLPGFANTCFI